MFTFLGGWEILLSQYFRPRLWVICLMSLDDSRFWLWCYEISTFSWASKQVSISVFTLLWVLVWITKLLFRKALILLLSAEWDCFTILYSSQTLAHFYVLCLFVTKVSKVASHWFSSSFFGYLWGWQFFHVFRFL